MLPRVMMFWVCLVVLATSHATACRPSFQQTPARKLLDGEQVPDVTVIDNDTAPDVSPTLLVTEQGVPEGTLQLVTESPVLEVAVTESPVLLGAVVESPLLDGSPTLLGTEVRTMSGGSKYCGALTTDPTPGACGNVTTTSRAILHCDVGGRANTKTVYKPVAQHDTRFSAANFSLTCLANAGVACDDPSNSDPKAQTDPAKHACCSCFLYTNYCAGKSTTCEYHHDTIAPGTRPHSLLMPTKPCTGIENWDRGSCPGEFIWDQGQADFDKAGKDGLAWGMAINPVSRRGQHQMHVHVAQVQPTLAYSIAYAFHTKGQQKFSLDCGLDNTHRTMENCVLASAANRFNPLVEIEVGKTKPSGMIPGPFERVYGKGDTKLSNKNREVLWASMLVIRVPFTTDAWAVVTNQVGPAECFFAGNDACRNK